MPDQRTPAPLATAELLAVGAELLVGETRDTNSGDIARELTALGVEVTRMTQLPDDQAVVTDALRQALQRVDLVITSGGLGPTPDDLTREAIAAALSEEPAVDPDLEAWLRSLWAKRGLPFVFVTGYGERSLPEPYRGRPALQKPFQAEQLKTTLAGLLA